MSTLFNCMNNWEMAGQRIKRAVFSRADERGQAAKRRVRATENLTHLLRITNYSDDFFCSAGVPTGVFRR